MTITGSKTSSALAALAIGACLSAAILPAAAKKISNPVAVFSALDKITAKITTIEVPVNSPVRFGALEVIARVCYSRPVTERPKTTAFVEVDAHQLNGEIKRLFTGWMFAASPGLNSVEHPVYDVWLKTCKASAPATPAPGRAKKSP